MNIFKFTLEGVGHDQFFLDIVRNIIKQRCVSGLNLNFLPS